MVCPHAADRLWLQIVDQAQQGHLQMMLVVLPYIALRLYYQGREAMARCGCRFHGVAGLGAFDLETFLSMTERSRKWQCPHSQRNLSVYELQTDAYVQRLLKCLEVGMGAVLMRNVRASLQIAADHLEVVQSG